MALSAHGEFGADRKGAYDAVMRATSVKQANGIVNGTLRGSAAHKAYLVALPGIKIAAARAYKYHGEDRKGSYDTVMRAKTVNEAWKIYSSLRSSPAYIAYRARRAPIRKIALEAHRVHGEDQ